MPVLAVIGAAIGAEIAGTALAAGISSALGVSAAVGGAIAGAIGGAIGGALGGGVNSVMQGGDFWDGAKSGALGGALGGAFTGIGGIEGLTKAMGMGGEAASTGLTAASDTFMATPGYQAANPFSSAAAATPDLASTISSQIGPASVPGLAADYSAGGLAGAGLGNTSLGTIAGSAPITGSLGSTTGMQSSGQVGNQNTLGSSLNKMFSDKDPMKLAGSVYDYYDKANIANQGKKDVAAVQARYNQLGNTLWGEGNSMLANATTNSNNTRDRINAVFAKYGLKGQ